MVDESSEKMYKDIMEAIGQHFPREPQDDGFARLCLKIFFDEYLDDGETDHEWENVYGDYETSFCGFDAMLPLVSEDRKMLYLFQFNLHESKKETFPKPAPIRSLMEGKIYPATQKHESDLKEISEKLVAYKDQGYKFQYHFFMAYTDNNVPQKYETFIQDEHYIFYDLPAVYRELKEYQSAYKDEKKDIGEISLHLVQNMGFLKSLGEEPRKTTVGLVTGYALQALYQKYRRALFKGNVRYALDNTKINKAIRKTAAEQPENFYFYNNGITFLCETLGVDDARKAFTMTNPRIINGAQTVSSLAKAYEEMEDGGNKEKAAAHFERIHVLVRIMEMKTSGGYEDPFSQNIIRFNNSQNNLTEKHRLANHPLQERLFAFFKTHGFFYDYRKGMEKRPGIKITFDHFLPSYVAFHKKTSFASVTSLFTADQLEEFFPTETALPLDIIFTAHLYIELQEIKSLIKKASKAPFSNSFDSLRKKYLPSETHQSYRDLFDRLLKVPEEHGLTEEERRNNAYLKILTYKNMVMGSLGVVMEEKKAANPLFLDSLVQDPARWERIRPQWFRTVADWLREAHKNSGKQLDSYAKSKKSVEDFKEIFSEKKRKGVDMYTAFPH